MRGQGEEGERVGGWWGEEEDLQETPWLGFSMGLYSRWETGTGGMGVAHVNV